MSYSVKLRLECNVEAFLDITSMWGLGQNNRDACTLTSCSELWIGLAWIVVRNYSRTPRLAHLMHQCIRCLYSVLYVFLNNQSTQSALPSPQPWCSLSGRFRGFFLYECKQGWAFQRQNAPCELKSERLQSPRHQRKGRVSSFDWRLPNTLWADPIYQQLFPHNDRNAYSDTVE